MTYRVQETETYNTPHGLVAVSLRISSRANLAAGRSGVVHVTLGDGRSAWLYVADRETGVRLIDGARVLNRDGRFTALRGAWLTAARAAAERYAGRLRTAAQNDARTG